MSDNGLSMHVQLGKSVPFSQVIEKMLQFNLMRVEIHELRPEVVTEDNGVLVNYQSRTNV